MWLAAIEELKADGLEGTIAPNDLFDEEDTEQAQTLWHLSDGADSDKGRWVNSLLPDGVNTGVFLADPIPLGDRQSGPPPDPKLYVTYDGSMGEPHTPAFGTEKGLMGKLKDAVDPDTTQPTPVRGQRVTGRSRTRCPASAVLKASVGRARGITMTKSIAAQSLTELGGPRSVLARQKRDHVELDRLIRGIDEVNGPHRQELLTKLCRLVFSHAFAEESVLWPVVRRVLPNGEQLTVKIEREFGHLGGGLGPGPTGVPHPAASRRGSAATRQCGCRGTDDGHRPASRQSRPAVPPEERSIRKRGGQPLGDVVDGCRSARTPSAAHPW